jgi:hypothetical protein
LQKESIVEERHHYRGGLVWPVILIGAGIVFLLNNLGVLGWGVWQTLWRLWPVLLIAIGLDILIGRRSVLGSALVALILLAVLAGAIVLGLPTFGLPTFGLPTFGLPTFGLDRSAAIERTEPISEDLKGTDRADVEIGFGTGSLQLGALPEGSAQLLRGTADLSKGESLELNHHGSGSIDRLELRSRNAWQVSLNFPVDNRKRWDLELNRDIPLNLKVDIGVGESTLDLTQLELTRLEIDGGVGQATIKLPVRGRYPVEISGGIGEVTLIVPEGLAARINVDGGLGNVDVADRFNRSGDRYVSPDFKSAENRAEIDVDGGIGRVVIRSVSE